MNNPQPKKKPLQQLELMCILLTVMPAILMFTGGHVHNAAQAIFRLSLCGVGFCSLIAIKVYQQKKMRGH